MATRPEAPTFRPWVEGVAGSIGDPVQRLRFLRAVAPAAAVRGERRWWSRSTCLVWWFRCTRGVRWFRVVLLLLSVVAALVSISFMRAAARVPSAPQPRPAVPSASPKDRQPSDVWRVEETGTSEVYSNGLRIDNTYAVPNRPRSYLAFPAAHEGQPIQRSAPAGIVFHSTESQLAPFEAGHNETLKRIEESLLDYLSRHRSYHFLIDRFGRVYRVVAETDAANHAGHSVWADDQWFYVNLNDSFLGVAFESRTGGAETEPEMTAAQVRSGAMLTEMLRVRHRIAAEDCVTHAQVSVNPSNMRIGYHSDWAAEFPFEGIGLPDQYATALPSIWAFGFEWDENFRKAAGGKLRLGIDAAAQLVNQRALAAGVRPLVYRKQLEQQYRRQLALVRGSGPGNVQ